MASTRRAYETSLLAMTCPSGVFGLHMCKKHICCLVFREEILSLTRESTNVLLEEELGTLSPSSDMSVAMTYLTNNYHLQNLASSMCCRVGNLLQTKVLTVGASLYRLPPYGPGSIYILTLPANYPGFAMLIVHVAFSSPCRLANSRNLT